MTTAEASLACAEVLVHVLVRAGVGHACVSPGSRSTPIALALWRHPGLTVHVHLDERSGGFHALGLAKALRAPVAVACTSGTAAAELFPAIVEASQSRVPLIVLTADRPPALRGTGANQTIDQVQLYGRFVRRFAEAETPDPVAVDLAGWTHLAEDALRHAVSEPAGPVHLNLPFDEPLVPAAVTSPVGNGAREAGRVAGVGWPEPAPGSIDRLSARLGPGSRGVIIATTLRGAAPSVHRLAASLRWPLIAEPTSGLRLPGSASAAGTVLAAGWDPAQGEGPEVVMRIGPPSVARATQRFLHRAHHTALVDTEGLAPDVELLHPEVVTGDAEAITAALLPHATAPGPGDERWLTTWERRDTAVRTAIDGLLDAWEEPSEMRAARDVAAVIPDGGTLFVGNSMPVRDLDAFMAPREGLRVIANRGASGIDGLLSTSFGVAASGTGPVVALLGDLSFLYDAGGLLWNARRGIDLVVVVNDNAGGQIFAGLGQHELPAGELERLFVTPHRADLEMLCAAAGAGYRAVDRAADLGTAVTAASAAGGVQVVRVTIDADRDRERRSEIRAAVSTTLAGVDPG